MRQNGIYQLIVCARVGGGEEGGKSLRAGGRVATIKRGGSRVDSFNVIEISNGEMRLSSTERTPSSMPQGSWGVFLSKYRNIKISEY